MRLIATKPHSMWLYLIMQDIYKFNIFELVHKQLLWYSLLPKPGEFYAFFHQIGRGGLYYKVSACILLENSVLLARWTGAKLRRRPPAPSSSHIGHFLQFLYHMIRVFILLYATSRSNCFREPSLSGHKSERTISRLF